MRNFAFLVFGFLFLNLSLAGLAGAKALNAVAIGFCSTTGAKQTQYFPATQLIKRGSKYYYNGTPLIGLPYFEPQLASLKASGFSKTCLTVAQDYCTKKLVTSLSRAYARVLRCLTLPTEKKTFRDLKPGLAPDSILDGVLRDRKLPRWVPMTTVPIPLVKVLKYIGKNWKNWLNDNTKTKLLTTLALLLALYLGSGALSTILSGGTSLALEPAKAVAFAALLVVVLAKHGITIPSDNSGPVADIQQNGGDFLVRFPSTPVIKVQSDEVEIVNLNLIKDDRRLINPSKVEEDKRRIQLLLEHAPQDESFTSR